ncbi:MAG: hypothetical protein HYR88_08910 [Verrucomicrobia bacterium]|nr:hypothetical protein [Verrucomicrobiota bacterium]MBI3870668.1 hypothetical protein [Verrucomicrobiota bacterium]
MSLKALHLLFIIVSTLLCFGFAGWALWAYSHEDVGRRANLIMGSTSAALGVALLAYGRYFLRKLRDVSYL